MTTGGLLIENLDASEYHADAIDDDRVSLSASIIHALCTSSPAHARAAHPRLNPLHERVEEEKFDVGNVIHELLLRGEEIAVEVAGFNDWRKDAAKEERDAIRAIGRIPLLSKDYARVLAMRDAIVAQTEAFDLEVPLLRDGKPEQTIVWDDAGVLCRARIDWLRDDLRTIDDIKTTARTADPEQWSRNTLYSIGADIQVAFYLRGMAAITGVRPEWRYVLCETHAPFAVSVVTLGASVVALADRKVEWALATWRWCLKHDCWPAYPREVFAADLMPWEEQRWLEREARQEIAAA